MPELPEVEALRRFLDRRCVGLRIDHAQVVAFACLKTAEIPLSALDGRAVTQVERRGKFLGVCVGDRLTGQIRPALTVEDGPSSDEVCDGGIFGGGTGGIFGGGTREGTGGGEIWLAFHLARAGWLRWHDVMPTALARPGRGPLAFRLSFTDGSGFDLTEAGTRQRLAVYLVRDLDDVPGVASLGPDPLSQSFTPETLDGILGQAGRAQIKGVLRDQHILAGVGNAYSDEVLWAARLSPFAAADRLTDEQRAVLYAALRGTLADAIDRADGVAAAGLKAEKKAGLNVHGRTGQPCPRCGTPIAEVSFADSSLQYCSTCQTGGRVLADRRMSRLLK